MELKMKIMTEEQTYAAMYHFLDQYYQRTRTAKAAEIVVDCASRARTKIYAAALWIG
jgi:hypothetical protein